MKKKFLFLWTPVIVWVGFIFYLSSLQIKPPTGTWLDVILPYIVHLTEYGVLFALIWRASKRSALSFLLIILYALADEFHQSFVPTRTADPFDVLTDIIGALLTYIVIWRSLLKARERRKN